MNIILAKAIRDKRFWVTTAAVAVKMGYFGFKYYPLLDDYIQYGIYPFAEHPFKNIFLYIGLYAYRPIAGLADIYLWGRFWGVMGIAFFIITLLHGISAYLFMIVFEKFKAPLGMVFAAVYLLCPINFEGSYWISASSRIVAGLFLASLAAYCLADNKAFFFFIFQFTAMFLYEQVAVFSFMLSLIIIYRTKNRKMLSPLFANIFIIVLYYAVFSRMGRFGGRISREIINFAAIKQITRKWLLTDLYTNGFIRGLSMSKPYLILIAAISFIIGASEKDKKFSPFLLLAGASLFAAPYLPFLFLAGDNISLRTAVVPLAGAAVAADTVLNTVKRFKPFIAGLLSFVFLIAAVSELSDYKENYLIDKRITEYVAAHLDPGRENAVTGAKKTYIEQNVFFGEHIKSITSSDWALTGSLRCYTGNRFLPMLQVNPDNPGDINLISLIDF